MANILEIESLRLAYRTRGTVAYAMNDVSLSIGDGEAVGLVGESGSGKSTLARATLGLIPRSIATIEAGRILIAGRDVTAFNEDQWQTVRGDPVAMVFQDPLSYLNPVMRVGRQIAESVRQHAPGMPLQSRVAELLSLVKLPASAADAYPHELSGGMRQRALLAVALGCGPKLLVADEPTTALDVTTQAEILALIAELRERLGMALLLISHDLGIVAQACERIYVMYAGHAIEWGSTADVFQRPAHPYTVGLLKAAQSERNADGRFATISGDPPNLSSMAVGCPFLPRCPVSRPECVEMPAPGPARNAGAQLVRCWAHR
jgi:oligopeptide/dipeptide ABC transporter ATP-binding protein